MSEILQYLTDHREDIVADMEEFVTRETPSTDKPRLDDFNQFLGSYARALGAEVEVVPVAERGDHLRVEWREPGDDREPVLLVGHFDTVWPVGTLEKMPFRVEGETAYGPGLFDMKGGLVQGFWAVRALRETGNLDRPVVFFCNSDEEVHSIYSRSYIEEESKAARAALVLESSYGGQLTTARKGAGSFMVEVTGREAHAGSNPFAGISAIEELAHLVIELHAHTDRESGTTVNVGVIEGGTRVNVVAGRASAAVNLRAVTEEEAERMTQVIYELQPKNPKAEITVTGGMVRPPMERDENIARLYELSRQLGAELGMEVQERMSGGGSDGNFSAGLGVPTLDGLGAAGQGAHATNEHIDLSTIPTRTALLARLIQEV